MHKKFRSERNTRIARRIYIDNYGTIPVDSNGISFEIHHKDGNHNNNNITNLVAVSVQEHYDLHLAQGDYGACILIGSKLNISKEERSDISRKSANKQIAEGVHNFLSGEIQSRTNMRRVKDGTHQFLSSEDASKRNIKRLENGTHHFLTNHPNKAKVICPYCNKEGGAAIMKRWHFENCKSK